MAESLLFIVECADGRSVSFGRVAAEWCEREGLAEHVDGPLWRSTVATPEQLERIVRAQPELRECDFCQSPRTGWRINVRPFRMPAMGGLPEVPMRDTLFACDDCVPLIRANDKRGLVTRAIDGAIARAQAQGGYLAAVVESNPRHRIDAQLGPPIREFVERAFEHRKGWPERDT